MTDNHYAPPRTSFAPPDQPRRPIPVYLITLWCTLQVVGIAIFMSSNWGELNEVLASGVESPIRFVGRLIFPLLFFISGLLLFFMRKSATYAFSIYLAWGILKVVLHARSSPSLLDLVMTTGITFYVVRLHRRGQLI